MVQCAPITRPRIVCSTAYWRIMALPRLDYAELFLKYAFSEDYRREWIDDYILFSYSSSWLPSPACDRSFRPHSSWSFLGSLFAIRMESLMNTYPVNILQGTHTHTRARMNRCIIRSSDIPKLWWIFMTMGEGSISEWNPNWIPALLWSLKRDLRPFSLSICQRCSQGINVEFKFSHLSSSTSATMTLNSCVASWHDDDEIDVSSTRSDACAWSDDDDPIWRLSVMIEEKIEKLPRLSLLGRLWNRVHLCLDQLTRNLNGKWTSWIGRSRGETVTS